MKVSRARPSSLTQKTPIPTFSSDGEIGPTCPRWCALSGKASAGRTSPADAHLSARTTATPTWDPTWRASRFPERGPYKVPAGKGG